MDATAHYRSLLALGRAGFVASAAPAALVLQRGLDQLVTAARAAVAIDDDAETIDEAATVADDDDTVADPTTLEVYPLTKKANASFPDRITIGRTANNDIVIDDPSVSRLHAYVRQAARQWLVADAGSKNGTSVAGTALEPRKERVLASKTAIRVGEVELTFYLAEDLFSALGGS